MKGSRKRVPEVVVFEEPTRKKPKKNLKQRILDKSVDVGTINFKEIAREVRELGVSGFKKKDQRKYKQKEAQALGGKAQKNKKMPYPLLIELKKIKNKKEEKQRELEAAMGMYKKKRKSDAKDKQIIKGSGRWVDRSKGLDGGKFKKGVRKIKQNDIAKFKKSKT